MLISQKNVVFNYIDKTSTLLVRKYIRYVYTHIYKDSIFYIDLQTQEHNTVVSLKCYQEEYLSTYAVYDIDKSNLVVARLVAPGKNLFDYCSTCSRCPINCHYFDCLIFYFTVSHSWTSTRPNQGVANPLLLLS